MKMKLGKLIEQIRGVSYKPADLHNELDCNSVVLLRANNINEGKINFKDVVYVDKSKVKEEQYLRKGDIFICASSGSKHLVGKAAYISEDLKAVFGAFCKIVRLKNKDFAQYVGHYFDSPIYRTFMDNASQGTNINNIRNEDIEELEINWIDDISTQQKIVAKLDNLNLAIDKCKRLLELHDELIKSKFYEMFGDLGINSKNWVIESFNDFATIDGKMTTDFEKYADYPHIGIDSIEKDSGELKGYRTVKEDNVISGKYMFTPEHIIYSKIRPNLNKVALPNFEGLCSADSYPILPIKGKCNRVFLAYNMRSNFFLDYILKYSRRTNMPKVNREQVSGFKSPLPPIELQNLFAQYVETVEASKTKIKELQSRIEYLKASYMQEFFA